MQTTQEANTRDRLLEIRAEASAYLGRELTDVEWAEAYPDAARKLDMIISREGDHGGARRQPWYLGKLIQEAHTRLHFPKDPFFTRPPNGKSNPPTEPGKRSAATPQAQKI